MLIQEAFREFNRPYYGVVLFEGFDIGDRASVYRWHIKDPVRFSKSLKVENEHKGRNPDSTGYLIGVDALSIDEITPYAVPAAAR